MPKQMTAEQKLTYMTETPLPRLVLSLSRSYDCQHAHYVVL